MESLTFFFFYAVTLFFGMLIFQEFGRKIGNHRVKKDSDSALKGTGVIEGGIFAVWGLLLAFTFSGASARFDTRRNLIAEETNAIGTAYLRLDLLPQSQAQELKSLFKKYLDSRIAFFKNIEVKNIRELELEKSQKLQKTIWETAMKDLKTSTQNFAHMLIVPALNTMFDITTTRYAAMLIHPPGVVYFLIFMVSLCCAMLVGFSQAETKKRSWLHILGFVTINVLIVFVILDMEYPRLGFIRVDSIDKILIDLRQSW